MAQLIVHDRVALQTVTALANLLRPPLPPDFPQNPFPVDARIGGPWGQMGRGRISSGKSGDECQ